MGKKRKSDYVQKPKATSEDAQRSATVLSAIVGDLTEEEAAARLGVSRVRFQTLKHRALGAFIEALRPKAPGRPATPEKQAQLAEENELLRKENERLKQQAEMTDRMLTMTSDLLRGRAKLRPREPRSTPTIPKVEGPDDEEPERRLEAAMQMRADGATMTRAASTVGTSAATLRRWRERKRAGKQLRERRGPGRRLLPGSGVETEVEALVRQTNGLPGASSLAKSVVGVSRRQAAVIKHRTLTAMERERVAACGRVDVSYPGVVRGFDAMDLDAGYALVASDAAVPYRTSIPVVERYDGASVAEALDRDFTEHGPPLVLREDRAACQRTPQVTAVLDRHHVLLLHGPAYYPRFYGQLERQNREHRAFLGDLETDDLELLAAEVSRMRDALNRLWRRPTLGWCTAEEVWQMRPPLDVDRDALRLEVQDRAARLRRHLEGSGQPADLADRLAIEHALAARGLLRVQHGGRG